MRRTRERFNPRSRGASDHLWIKNVTRMRKFQSTLARGERLPDGAIMAVSYLNKSGPGHVLVCEKADGVLRFIDPQENSRNAVGLIKKHNSFGFFRIDNLSLKKDFDLSTVVKPNIINKNRLCFNTIIGGVEMSEAEAAVKLKEWIISHSDFDFFKSYKIKTVGFDGVGWLFKQVGLDGNDVLYNGNVVEFIVDDEGAGPNIEFR